MSRYECWARLIHEHSTKHQGILSVVARVALYCVGLFAIMSASAKFFGDTYTANLSLFMVFSVVVELLWNHAHKGARFWWYIFCILGIGLSGASLIFQAMNVQAAQTLMGGR